MFKDHFCLKPLKSRFQHVCVKTHQLKLKNHILTLETDFLRIPSSAAMISSELGLIIGSDVVYGDKRSKQQQQQQALVAEGGRK